MPSRSRCNRRRRIGRDGDQPEEYIFSTRDKKTFIHWIEDHKIGVNYILVKGAETAPIAKILRANFLNFTSEDIYERARDNNASPEDRRLALYHLALDKMEHGFDKDTFEIYKQAMSNADAVVRGSAVLGSAYLAWPQLAEPMRPLAGPGEPDKSIQKDARLLVERLDKLSAAPTK